MAVNRYVVLIRGINVGGRKKLAMEDLRHALRALGHADVETYLQSGNALFTSTGSDTTALGHEIEQQLSSSLGLEVKALVRSPEDLADIVARNPFPDASAEPSKLHVAFLAPTPDGERLAALDTSRFEPDQFRPGDRAIYLWYPNGAGRSKLTTNLLERQLGVTATARNWKTVTKLLERSSTGSDGGPG